MRVEIIPLGEVESWVLITASDTLENTYKLKIDVKESVKIPENAYQGNRKQYDASELLRYIKKIKDGKYALGLIDEDIYADGLNFVFGQAEFGCCATLSICRLKSKSESKYKERVEKEVVHEAGHAFFELGHCSNRDCVMSFSNSLIEVDLKGKELCENCKRLI